MKKKIKKKLKEDQIPEYNLNQQTNGKTGNQIISPEMYEFSKKFTDIL